MVFLAIRGYKYSDSRYFFSLWDDINKYRHLNKICLNYNHKKVVITHLGIGGTHCQQGLYDRPSIRI